MVALRDMFHRRHIQQPFPIHTLSKRHFRSHLHLIVAPGRGRLPVAGNNYCTLTQLEITLEEAQYFKNINEGLSLENANENINGLL